MSARRPHSRSPCPTSPVVIPARRGKAAFVSQCQMITVINTHGAQRVDTRIFSRVVLGELMSMEHTRGGLCRLIPAVGADLLTNRRRPIPTLQEDTAGGIQDALMAACHVYRYQGPGCTG